MDCETGRTAAAAAHCCTSSQSQIGVANWQAAQRGRQDKGAPRSHLHGALRQGAGSQPLAFGDLRECELNPFLLPSSN